MKKKVWEYGKTIVLALLVALAITTFIKPTLVQGYSMYPTIQPHNYLIVNRTPYLAGTPKHGDIIVFRANLQTPQGEDKDLIKRVIGLPGDLISIHDGMVYRNGEALHEDYIYGGVTPGEMDPVKVRKDCVFVLGDNRPISRDSRDPAVGQIKMSNIIGRADLRLYPFNEIGII